jgi:hypothetical protein
MATAATMVTSNTPAKTPIIYNGKKGWFNDTTGLDSSGKQGTSGTNGTIVYEDGTMDRVPMSALTIDTSGSNTLNSAAQATLTKYLATTNPLAPLSSFYTAPTTSTTTPTSSTSSTPANTNGTAYSDDQIKAAWTSMFGTNPWNSGGSNGMPSQITATSAPKDIAQALKMMTFINSAGTMNSNVVNANQNSGMYNALYTPSTKAFTKDDIWSKIQGIYGNVPAVNYGPGLNITSSATADEMLKWLDTTASYRGQGLNAAGVLGVATPTVSTAPGKYDSLAQTFGSEPVGAVKYWYRSVNGIPTYTTTYASGGSSGDAGLAAGGMQQISQADYAKGIQNNIDTMQGYLNNPSTFSTGATPSTSQVQTWQNDLSQVMGQTGKYSKGAIDQATVNFFNPKPLDTTNMTQIAPGMWVPNGSPAANNTTGTPITTAGNVASGLPASTPTVNPVQTTGGSAPLNNTNPLASTTSNTTTTTPAATSTTPATTTTSTPAATTTTDPNAGQVAVKLTTGATVYFPEGSPGLTAALQQGATRVVPLASSTTTTPAASSTTTANTFASLGFPTTSVTPTSSTTTIKQLQDALVKANYMTQDQVNSGYGVYGPQTTAAVLQMQKDLQAHNPSFDYSSGPGSYGPLTISAAQSYTPTATTSTATNTSTTNTANTTTNPDVSTTVANNANVPGGTAAGNALLAAFLKDPANAAAYNALPPAYQQFIGNNANTLIDQIKAGNLVNTGTLTPQHLSSLYDSTFQDQAKKEVDPYYQDQYSALKTGVTQSLSRMAEDYNTSTSRMIDPFKQALKDQSENEAQAGTAFSSGRIDRQNTQVTDQNNKLTDVYTNANRSAQDLLQGYESNAGTTNARSISLPTLSGYNATNTGIQNTGQRTLDLALAGNINYGTIGTNEQAAILNRASQLEGVANTDAALNKKTV